MVLRKAVEADYEEVIDLANLAYRGREGAVASWNIEKGIVGGQRLDIPCCERDWLQNRMVRCSSIAMTSEVRCWVQCG